MPAFPIDETPSPSASGRRAGPERREQILAEAARKFAETGFSGTPIRSIAAACGITEAALYKYFQSKEELFEAALETQIRDYDIEGFLRGLPEEQPLLDTFRAIASQVLEVGLEDPTIHRLLLAASVSGPTQTSGLYVSWRLPFVRHLEKLIRRGIARGEIVEVDPLLTARAFVGLVMDCVLSCDLWSKLGYAGYTPDQLVNNNVPTFVRGLLRSPGPVEEREEP